MVFSVSFSALFSQGPALRVFPCLLGNKVRPSQINGQSEGNGVGVNMKRILIVRKERGAINTLNSLTYTCKAHTAHTCHTTLTAVWGNSAASRTHIHTDTYTDKMSRSYSLQHCYHINSLTHILLNSVLIFMPCLIEMPYVLIKCNCISITTILI